MTWESLFLPLLITRSAQATGKAALMAADKAFQSHPEGWRGQATFVLGV